MNEFDEAEIQRKREIKLALLTVVFFFTFAITSFIVAIVIDKFYPIVIALVWLYCGGVALQRMEKLTK
jgi:hypothetical protein